MTTTATDTLYPILQTSFADEPLADFAVVGTQEAEMFGIRVGKRVILEDFGPEERLRFYGTVTSITTLDLSPGRLAVHVDIGDYDEPAPGCWFLDDDSP